MPSPSASLEKLSFVGFPSEFRVAAPASDTLGLFLHADVGPFLAKGAPL